VGRESGQIRLEVLANTTQREVEAWLATHRSKAGTCYSDESNAYNHVRTPMLEHRTVCHSRKEWARDDDGDGVNEVHTNTIEGLWTELRNFLRRFKGVSKHYIHLYIAMFEWMHNLKKVSAQFIQTLVGSLTGT
jgi:transposase